MRQDLAQVPGLGFTQFSIRLARLALTPGQPTTVSVPGGLALDMLWSPAGFPVTAITGQGKSSGHRMVLRFSERPEPALNNSADTAHGDQPGGGAARVEPLEHRPGVEVRVVARGVAVGQQQDTQLGGDEIHGES